MLEGVNRIYFKKSDFDSLDEMFEALFTQQLALTKNSNMCLVYQLPADKNVFILEFASLDPMFNQDRVLPCWITSYEANSIARDRLQAYKENLEDIVSDSLKLDIDDDFDDDPNGGNNNAA